jgi:hypothetical protein
LSSATVEFLRMPPKRKTSSAATTAVTKKASKRVKKRIVVEPSESSDSGSIDEGAFEASVKARDAAMAVVGVAETDVIASLLPSSLFGGSMPRAVHTVRGPKPAKGANRVVMMCTSGHADPLPDGPLGAAVELFALDDAPQLARVKTGIELASADAHIFQAVSETSVLADNLREMFDDYGSRSFEIRLPDETFALVGVDRARWTDPNTGRTGVLLTPAVDGCIGPTPKFTVDGYVDEGNIIMACVRFLTAAELQLVITGGPKARLEIVKRLAEQNASKQQFCSLTRACVAPPANGGAGKATVATAKEPSKAKAPSKSTRAAAATADTSSRSRSTRSSVRQAAAASRR